MIPSVLTQKLRRNPGRVRAVFYAVLVHVVVIGLIVIGFRWTSQPTSDQKVIQATAVPQTPPKKPEAPKPPTAEEQQARQKAEADKRQQTELKKKQEEQQRLEIARQKKAAEEKLQKQKELEQKRAAEATRQQEQKRQQKQAEQSLQEQLVAEEKERVATARAARAATVVDQYKALIRSRVSHSWSRPLSSAQGLKCVVRVRLTPSGEVLDAKVVKSSGDPVFDRSVENAVYKAAPLPLPDDPSLFDNFREIEFLFNPETQ